MARKIVLDSFPLSCAGRAQSPHLTLTEDCRRWLLSCVAAGNSIYVPSLAYYEVLRELERLNASGQILRLKAFCSTYPDRFIAPETKHLEEAAKMWAGIRQQGCPTASPDALDGDVIIAAQALSLGFARSKFVVATTNVDHLVYFVPAEDWKNILPGS